MVTFCNGERIALLGVLAFCMMSSMLGSPASPAYRKPFPLDPYVPECSRNMACKWAVCLWSPDQDFTDSSCSYFDNHCVCPEGNECAITEFSEPTARFVTWEFRCQRWEVLHHK